MVITHKLRPMYLTCKNVTQRVDVMQDDKYSRCLEIPLRANGDDVELPEDVRAVIRYQKPDGTGGNYDTLPDGTSAYTVSGNVITVALAPQVCVVPGIVQMVVCLMQGNAEINTFVILVNVHRNPGIDAESQDYTNMRAYVKSYGWPPDKTLRTDADGNVIADDAPGGAATGGYYTPSIDTDGNLKWTASNPGMPEVGGANIKGQKGKSAYQYAVEGGYTGTEAEFAAKMAADYIQAPLAAAVGQTIVVKAVDENGKPTEWETADVPSGGDGWTEIGEITLGGTEFIISAYSDGVVTITSENGVYPPVNKATVLRKPDYSAYKNVRFIATGTEGQYTMKNIDGEVYAPSDDMTQYVVDVPSADSISFSNIPEFSHLKAKVTTPLLAVHGIRQTLNTTYAPFDLVGGDCAYLSGGAAEVVLETEDSPIAGKIYGKGSFKGISASRSNGYDIIRMFDRPTAPANISFAHYNGLLTIGTKVKLWGRN